MSDGEGKEFQGGAQFGDDAREFREGAQFGGDPGAKEKVVGPPSDQGYPTYGGPGQRRSRGIRPWIVGCLVAFGLFLLVAGIGCTFAWSRFVRFGIDSDLVDYREAVRGAELNQDTRSRLVFKIEHLRDALPGKSLGLMEWVSHNEALEGLVADGTLTAEEAVLMERELDRIAKALGTAFPGELEASGPAP